MEGKPSSLFSLFSLFFFFIIKLEYIVFWKHGLTNKNKYGTEYGNWGFGIAKDMEIQLVI